MGGDDDRGAEPVELDEQPEQAVADGRIDIAGGLVGEQELGPADHGPGDGRALLLAAGQDLGVGVDALAEPDPVQQVGHVVGVVALLLAHDAQGQRHILPGGEVVEQAEILENDADSAPERRPAAGRQIGDILAKNEDQTPAGRRDMKRRRKSEVFPAPDGPVRK